MENVGKHKDTQLVTTEVRGSCFLSEPNYHTIFFSENLLAVELKRTIFMNKSVNLHLSILELSKIVMYEF